MIGHGAQRRLNCVAVVAALPIVLVMGRLVWLQVISAEELSRRAESQHVRRVWLPPQRGKILDRNQKPLAYTMVNYSIVAEPAKVTHPARTARTLASALDRSPRELERLLRSKKRQVSLERKVAPILERRVDLNSLAGVREQVELKRVYPLGESAAHVVGFLDHQEQGYGGMESELEDLLRGAPGWATELRDGLGNSFVALGRQSKPAQPGHNVVLTVDADLQDMAASALRKAARRLRAKGASLVAVAPRTGEILALVSWPSFDPEKVLGANPDALRNRAIVDPYEPGSTFKLVALATALTDKVIEPSTLIHCESGRHDFGGYVISDHHPYETLSFKECFAVSSNIAFAKVGNKCGSRLYEVARIFGFGSTTGIALAGEDPGKLRPPQSWSGRSAATLAIGYEVMATPLQLAMAYAAVANDGVLMRPRLINAVYDADGKRIFKGRSEEVRRVLDPKVAATVRSFMREVITDGTGANADIGWMEVGGKTGTSEKFVPGEGYSKSRHYASFVGIAPLDDPKVVLFVMIDEPQTNMYGGSAAAPVFYETIEAFGRLPGTWLGPEYARMVVKDPPREPLAKWMPSPLEANTDAGGFPGTPSPQNGLPDVRGESLRRALQILRAYGMTARVHGTGIVESQMPPPGSRVKGPVQLFGNRRSHGVTVLTSVTGVTREEGQIARSAGSPGSR